MKRILMIVSASLLALVSGSAQWRIPAEGIEVQGTSVTIQGLEADAGKKSPLLAIGLSLMLPGTGEWYAGNFQTGRFFLAADGALWLTYTAFTLQGGWIRDDARTFAGFHAGVSFQGKDEKFDVDIGNFNTLQEYNQAKLRNREFDLLYQQGAFDWSWDDEVNRLHYRGLRIKSDEMFQNAKFVVGALVVNRIISAFSAWRSATRFNREAAQRADWRISTHVQGALPNAHGFGITVSREW